MMRRTAGVVAMLVLLLAGCTSDPGEPAPGTGSPTQAEAGPAIELTYPPEEGDAIPAGEVIVAVTVRSFEVVDKLGDPAEDGQGHIHYYIDVADLPTEPGKPAVTDDERTYHAAAETSHRWQDVEPGMHTFAVQLVNNDHTPLEPPVTDEVRVRVGS